MSARAAAASGQHRLNRRHSPPLPLLAPAVVHRLLRVVRLEDAAIRAEGADRLVILQGEEEGRRERSERAIRRNARVWHLQEGLQASTLTPDPMPDMAGRWGAQPPLLASCEGESGEGGRLARVQARGSDGAIVGSTAGQWAAAGEVQAVVACALRLALLPSSPPSIQGLPCPHSDPCVAASTCASQSAPQTLRSARANGPRFV